MTPGRIGFVGLGQMGNPMATNIAAGEFALIAYDKAGTAPRTPAGAQVADSLIEVAEFADSIFLSLPDGAASLEVIQEVINVPRRQASTFIDLSTIGPTAACEAARITSQGDMTYIDAPVSGGQAGARAGTITVMWAGPEAELERHRDILKTFSGNLFHVGDRAGQGQALKILNNFLSGTALAATSEAILYGLSQRLDMKTMLDVINASSGQNSASRDKFPERILTGTFDAGFKTALLAKDLNLYLENARAAGTPDGLGSMVAEFWAACDKALPDSDCTRFYEFIRDAGKK